MIDQHQQPVESAITYSSAVGIMTYAHYIEVAETLAQQIAMYGGALLIIIRLIHDVRVAIEQHNDLKIKHSLKHKSKSKPKNKR